MVRHKYCLFPGCRGLGESVFRLPKEPGLRAKWIEAICNPEFDYEDKTLPEYRFVVYSLHFKKDDYQVKYVFKRASERHRCVFSTLEFRENLI